MNAVTLLFLCGKMAAGKSTLARELARAHQAILLEEDHFLDALFPGEIHAIADYVTYSGSPFTTEAEFEAVTKYFQPPSAEEGFNVVMRNDSQVLP